MEPNANYPVPEHAGDDAGGRTPRGVNFRDLFRTRSLRWTRQRERVYAALWSCTTHPTVEELHRAVQAQDPNVSLATVYNTLDVLREAGLCRRLPTTGNGGSARYDADIAEHAHVATPDGRLLDLPDDLSERILQGMTAEVRREIESRLGIRLGRVAVQLVVDGEGVRGGN